MSQRPSRLRSTIKAQQQQEDDDNDDIIVLPPPSSTSSTMSSLSQKVLSSTANLANLLPTGTLLAFQILTPITTNNGSCDAATRSITIIFLLVLAASVFLACFTDSFRDPEDGQVYYGIATRSGMWLWDYYDNPRAPSVDVMSKYRLRLVDGVHAVLSVLVFGSVALRDKNVVGCFYGPRPEHEMQEVLDIVPVCVGLLCSFMFVVFPTTRHGIGCPVTHGR